MSAMVGAGGTDDPIADQVIEWLVLLRSGEASDADVRELARWLSGDPRREATWRRLNGALAPFRTAAVQRLPKGTLARGLLQRSANRRTIIKACLALGTAGAGGLWVADRFLPIGDLLADLRTDTAERRTYRLADGSSVVLGARTAMETEFDQGHRILNLRHGVVLADVLPDPSRPFIVRTPVMSVGARDGSFVVSYDGSSTTTTVIRAQARIVIAGGGPVDLPAGRRAWLDRGVLQHEEADVESETLWTEGVLVVNDRPISYMVDALRPYFPGIIRLHSEVAGLRVTGVFRLDDPQQAMDMLAQTLPVRVSWFTPYFVSVTTQA